jgi:PAS domain S-box-containing protein
MKIPPTSKPLQHIYTAAIISALYFGIGFMWIYVTYFYVRGSLQDTNQISLLNNQTLLRSGFILVSSALLFGLIRYYYRKIESSAGQYQRLFEKNPNPMWVFDSETLQFLAVNDAALEKYGYSKNEFLSMTITDIRPGDEVDRLMRINPGTGNFRMAGVWKHRLKDGSTIHVEVSSHQINYNERKAKLVLAYDVSDRVKFEEEIIEFNSTLELKVNQRTSELHEAMQEQAALLEELETFNEELISTNEKLVEAEETIRAQANELVKKTETRLDHILNSIKDFIWSARYNGKNFHVESMSPAVLDVLGFTYEEYIKNPGIWFACIAEEDRGRVLEFTSNISKNKYLEIEFCIRHQRTWAVRYVLSRVWISKIDEDWFELNGMISDISERKKQEEEKSNLIKQLVTQNNDLMQFSYIASHNLRGPVATLLGLVDLIEKEKKPESIKAISTHLLHSTRKLDDVIVDLTKILDIRAQQGLAKENVELGSIIDNVKEILSSQFESSQAKLICDLAENESLFTIKSYLHSIVYNLVANGVKYRSKQRRPIIRITSFKNENRVGFMVSDNGLGIDLEKFQHKLFSLYQRFHTHVDGKGMGLYLVRTQTLALGGEIDVESKLEEGTTFKISFPVFIEAALSKAN